jgi:hypothetical protein
MGLLKKHAVQTFGGDMADIFNGVMKPGFDMSCVHQSILRDIEHVARGRGLVSRDEVEALFTMDRYGFVSGDEWFAFAVQCVSDYIIWEARPTGHVTEQDADWMIGLVGDRPTAFGRAILFSLVREAETVPARISELVMRAAVGRCLLI